MSVLIKGMEKPEHCGYCRFRYDGICHALQKTQYSMNECPLVVIDDAGLNDTISRQAAMDAIKMWGLIDGLSEGEAIEILSDEEKLPSAQPDSGYIEQMRWERDLAIRQLAVLGYGLGEKPRTNGDLISRQALLESIERISVKGNVLDDDWIYRFIQEFPSAQPELHYCRECKWSWCYIKVDKHGNSETYWRCRNWDGETDEEGYCHEWERKEE